MLDLRRKFLTIDMRKKASNNHRLDLRKMAVVAEAENNVDMRQGISFDYAGIVSENNDENNPTQTHEIRAFLGGTQVGYLVFTAHISTRKLFIDAILVDYKYRDVGFEMMLLKEFDNIYRDNFDGWPLVRYFNNPFDELKFRQAVSLNWLSKSMLQEEEITRNYDDDSQQLWDSIKGLVPEDYRGANLRYDLRKYSKQKINYLNKQAEIVDIRNVEFEVQQITSDEFQLAAKSNGKNIGYIDYMIVDSRKLLFIDYIEVDQLYRGCGIGTLLYKELGGIYNDKCPNYKIYRTFVNPIAEYAFNKAVALGWFPDNVSTYEDDRMKRMYSEEEKYQWENEFKPKIKDMRRKKEELLQEN